jgi:hypothetical protein
MKKQPELETLTLEQLEVVTGGYVGGWHRSPPRPRSKHSNGPK